MPAPLEARSRLVGCPGVGRLRGLPVGGLPLSLQYRTLPYCYVRCGGGRFSIRVCSCVLMHLTCAFLYAWKTKSYEVRILPAL